MKKHFFSKSLSDERVCEARNIDGPVPAKFTVPIAGVGRGGTTMVAAVVHALGIDLGPHDSLKAGHSFEDRSMRRRGDGPTGEDTRISYIGERNKSSDIWGWKIAPLLTEYSKIESHIRNPRFIVVFRDPLCVAQRRDYTQRELNESKRVSFEQLFDEVVKLQRINWHFVRSTHFPVLLVPYERVLNNRSLFVDEVIDFLNLTPTDSQRKEAEYRISPIGGYFDPQALVSSGDELEEWYVHKNE